ncbi:helix-turn-helix domain-containing protein [Polynucleobacter bastaniensis]|jgi:excisionase family DNA binding protein|uniref:helix-turn-helix domain-containing protein n=1 Tax=Polynucleobacter bastaniensis TaxID=2081039 RepID=UPI001C0D25C3|nr:helix-turn-helix domain-containing protein [Polynucleobacter bastaniensis]MBU3598299.1 helix-turn-helix domain-containing protein [Polynucleobacter bastaniensis]
MTQFMNAEDLFAHVQKMPSKERIKFFSLVAINAFQETEYTHEQVFGHLRNTSFSAEEAAEFLEISLPTLRRHVQSGRLKPTSIIGRSQLFSSADLKLLKQKINKE